MEKLCIKCLEFYSAADQSETRCAYCNFDENNEDNRNLNNYCSSLYRFGWIYRKKFESDFAREQRVSKKYQFDVDSSVFAEVVKFLLLAVASGITYDVIKNTMKMFFTYNDNKIKDEAAKEEFDKFIHYIAEYHTGKFSCENEIVSAIQEEELIYAVTEDLLPVVIEMQTNPDRCVEPISKRFVKARKRIDNDRKVADALVWKYARTEKRSTRKKKPEKQKNKPRL